MNWCILIPLIVGLISALLGYLLGRLSSKGNDNNADIELWQSKNAELETALADCKAKLTSTTSSSGSGGATSVASFAAGAATGVAFNAAAAKAAFGKKIKENDLTVVEGIGPKIQELFQKNGVTTWGALSTTAVSKLQEFLDSKGERYRVHNPGTWPDQAKMAFEGKWTELKKWQDEHDHGKA